MKHTITIKDNIVKKTYASRLDFVKEEKIYKQLQGSGLAPKLISSHDGYLEHEYVQGENFLELLAKASGDEKTLEDYFKLFFDWYKQFRNKTALTLGQVRFEKFILHDDSLCNIDFEQCKPGYMEEDIARLVAQMCMIPNAFSNEGMKTARFFISAGAKHLDWMPEMLASKLPSALTAECKAKGFSVDERKVEYLTTILTTTGAVVEGGDTPLSDCTTLLWGMPQQLIIENRSNTIEEAIAAQKNSNQVWTLLLTTDMPKIPEILLSEIFSTPKERTAAVIIEAAGKLREYPVLLNNEMTKAVIEAAAENKETSLTDVLTKLNISVIKIEDIEKRLESL